MYITGIGNVTECNHSFIYLNTEGKQERLKATLDLLRSIFTQAEEDSRFYYRVKEVLRAEFEQRREKVEDRYHYITDDERKERYRAGGYKNGIGLEIEQQINNEECTRQFSAVYGFYDAVKFASDKWMEADKIKRQATAALNAMKA